MADPNRYVAMRLATGEDIISVIHDEDAEGYLLLHPMHVQSETDMEHHVEQYYAQPLCPFSDEKQYFMAKKHVMFVKPLSKYLIPFYHDMVQKFSESEIIKNARQRAHGTVSWGGQEITEEEAKKRLKQLQQLRGLADDIPDDDTTLH